MPRSGYLEGGGLTGSLLGQFLGLLSENVREMRLKITTHPGGKTPCLFGISTDGRPRYAWIRQSMDCGTAEQI